MVGSLRRTGCRRSSRGWQGSGLPATRGALGQFQNLFAPTLKLKEKKRDERGRLRRVYGEACTPYDRVLASAQVSAEKKEELRTLKTTLNPFVLKREIERQFKQIEKLRQRRLKR